MLVQEPEGSGENGRICAAPGCMRITRKQKPWCEEHILTHSPYVSELLAELEKRAPKNKTPKKAG